MNTEIPQDLPSYFHAHPERFEFRSSPMKKVYLVLAVVFLILAISPNWLPLPTWLVRTLSVVGVLYAAVKAYLDGHLYDKQTNSKLVQVAHKKFNSAYTTEETLLASLANDDFATLAQTPSLNNQPLQMYIFENVEGKTFYLLLMKYFSPSDFRGISPVKIVSGAAYEQNKELIRSINGF